MSYLCPYNFWYEQCTEEENHFHVMIVEFYNSLWSGNWELGSPRHSFVMREAWKTEELAIIRVYFQHMRIPAHPGDTEVWKVLSVIGDCVDIIIDEQLTAKVGTALLVNEIRTRLPHHWDRALQLYEDFKIKTRETIQKLLRGILRLKILIAAARIRANDRLYRPGGKGYQAIKERFEKMQQSTQNANL